MCVITQMHHRKRVARANRRRSCIRGLVRQPQVDKAICMLHGRLSHLEAWWWEIYVDNFGLGELANSQAAHSLVGTMSLVQQAYCIAHFGQHSTFGFKGRLAAAFGVGTVRSDGGTCAFEAT